MVSVKFFIRQKRFKGLVSIPDKTPYRRSPKVFNPRDWMLNTNIDLTASLGAILLVYHLLNGKICFCLFVCLPCVSLWVNRPVCAIQLFSSHITIYVGNRVTILDQVLNHNYIIRGRSHRNSYLAYCSQRCTHYWIYRILSTFFFVEGDCTVRSVGW